MSINRVVLVGRLTKDVDIRMTQSGTTVGNFTVAVNRNKTGNGGQVEADFIRCVSFGKTAENMQKYTHKGSQIAVEGRIQTGSYTDKNGNKVFTTDIACDYVQFLEPKQQQVNNYANSYQNPTSPPPFNPMGNAENPFAEEPEYDDGYEESGFEIDSDDLPF